MASPTTATRYQGAEVGVRPLSSWLDQRKIECWFELQQQQRGRVSRQAFEAEWHRQSNYMVMGGKSS
jgi:hypothetical protein